MIDPWAVWTQPVADWLVTYGVHSTAALSAVWLAERAGLLRRAVTRDVLWKAALLVGIVTASWRVTAGSPHPEWPIDLEGLSVDAGGIEEVREQVPTKAGPVPGIDPGAGRVTMQAHLRDPSPACLGALRAPRRLDPAGIDALRGACGADGLRARLPGILATLWAAGALLFLLLAQRRRRDLGRLLTRRRRVVGGEAVRALDRLASSVGMEGAVGLYWVEGLESPAVIGPRAIGVPDRIEELNFGELTSALGHELAHLVRRDRLWLGAARLVAALGFFQPLNRLALRRLQETAELLADDWAASRTGDPLQLARTLATVAGWVTGTRRAPALSMASGRSGLGQRVERLLSGEDVGGRPALSALLACALLCVSVAWIPAVSVPAGSSIQVETDGPGLERALEAAAGRPHRTRIVIGQVER